MKSILLSSIALVSMNAFAGKLPGKTDKVVCSFTEPFATVKADFTKKVLIIETVGDFDSGAISQRTDVVQHIAVNDGGHADIEVRYKSPYAKDGGFTVLHVTTVDKGSDGMSDKVFDSAAYLLINGKPQAGGCDFVNKL